MADRVGQQLGNYRLSRFLGQGGSGEVYLGEHIYHKTLAAVKVLQVQLEASDLKEFINEASTMLRLQHPHIVRLLDFGIDPANTPFLVMAYAAGGTLRKLHPKGTHLPLESIITYVSPIASALQHAHDERLIHRDVKPENILLGPNNEVWLSDFGITSVVHSTRSLDTEQPGGTVPYMAPEQLRGKARPASDQYALGLMVYEWLCGERPFSGTATEIAMQHFLEPPPSLREKMSTISPAVEQVVMTALAKDPASRFASVQAFATALQAAAGVQALLDAESAKTSGGSVGRVPTSSMAAAVDGTSPTVQTNEQHVPTLSPNVPSAEMVTSPATSFATNGRATVQVPLSVAQGKKPLPSVPITNSTIASRRGPFLRRAFLISGLAFLILVASSAGLFLFVRSNQIAADNAHATAIARAATATRYAAPTATAQYPATATAIALQNVYNSAPIFQDSLANNTNNWGQSANTSGENFSRGVLDLTTSSHGGASFFPIEPKQSLDFSNIAFRVEMKVTKGFGGGILFRAAPNIYWLNYYYFLVGTDGSYSLSLSNHYDPVTQHFTRKTDQMLTSGSTSAIHRGLNQTNLVGVVANGSALDLYINGEKIASVSDSVFGHGTIGLFVYDNGGPPDSTNVDDEVLFSNLEVWNL